MLSFCIHPGLLHSSASHTYVMQAWSSALQAYQLKTEICQVIIQEM